MNLQRYFVRTTALCLSLAVAVLGNGQHNSAMAGVIPATVVTDTQLNLEVTWAGVRLLDNGDDDDSLAVPATVNWTVGPNPLTLTYLGGGNGWTGTLTVVHAVNPHPGEPDGTQVTFNLAFDQIGITNSTTTKTVTHGSHNDIYTLTYAYTPLTDTFSAKLTGAHVPEPTTLTLAFVGAGFMLSRKLRRRKTE